MLLRILLSLLPDLPLCSPLILLRRNLDTDPDLEPYLDLVVDAPKEAIPLELFLLLLWGNIDLDPDLVLALRCRRILLFPFHHRPRLRRCRRHHRRRCACNNLGRLL